MFRSEWFYLECLCARADKGGWFLPPKTIFFLIRSTFFYNDISILVKIAILLVSKCILSGFEALTI